jgi:hypothetical protein
MWVIVDQRVVARWSSSYVFRPAPTSHPRDLRRSIVNMMPRTEAETTRFPYYERSVNYSRLLVTPAC